MRYIVFLFLFLFSSIASLAVYAGKKDFNVTSSEGISVHRLYDLDSSQYDTFRNLNLLYIGGTGVNNPKANILPPYLWGLETVGVNLYRLNISDEAYETKRDVLHKKLNELIDTWKRDDQNIVLVGQGEGAAFIYEHIASVEKQFVNAALMMSLHKDYSGLSFTNDDLNEGYVFFDKDVKHNAEFIEHLTERLNAKDRVSLLYSGLSGFKGRDSAWLFAYDYIFGDCLRTGLITTNVRDQDIRDGILEAVTEECWLPELSSDVLLWRVDRKHLEDIERLSAASFLSFVWSDQGSSSISKITTERITALNFSKNTTVKEKVLYGLFPEEEKVRAWSTTEKGALCLGDKCYDLYKWSDEIYVAVNNRTDKIEFYFKR